MYGRCLIIASKTITSLTLPGHAKTRTMSVFTQVLNPMTGRLDWEPRDEAYDYHQEVARSAYADMLHDHERNMKYMEALEKAIKTKQAGGQKAHVLDIGAGTGLLSMIAARAGADSIVACEAFQPMASCCAEILKRNGFEEKIKLIPKRSTELEVGPGKDLERKANILVTEVFDTELIGEGAIEVFTHAHEELLEEDCLVVPDRATMYILPVESNLVRGWNTLLPVQLPSKADGESTILKVPRAVSSCPGTNGVHDVHIAQIPKDAYSSLTEPVIAFEFDFGKRGALPKSRRSVIGPLEVKNRQQVVNGGGGDVPEQERRVDGVFMWWDLKMDVEGEIILSCAPEDDEPNWRDHWMQAVYFTRPNNLRVKDVLWLEANHDAYSLWFDASAENPKLPSGSLTTDMPACHCGAHVSIGRRRLGELNDPRRLGSLLKILEGGINAGHSVVAVLGDGPVLPVAACLMGAEKVFCFGDQRKLSVVKDYAKENGVDVPGQLEMFDWEDIDGQCANRKQIDLVLAEPFYSTAFLPWHNARLWYQMEKLRKSGLLSENAVCWPSNAKIFAVGVQYKDLWKIRAPLGKVLDFDVSQFDEVIEDAMSKSDPNVEPQPLWEYPCTALTTPVPVFSFDFGPGIPKDGIASTGMEPFQTEGVCNGVALWMEWTYPVFPSEPVVLSNGPLTPPVPGKTVKWYLHSQQGVHFLPEQRTIDRPWSTYLEYEAEFCPSRAQFLFQFRVGE